MARAPRRAAGRWLLTLWLAWAFVAWNVAFDRAVELAAIAFTREQIARFQQGESVRSIDEAFRPRLWPAALTATAWSLPILAAGIAIAARLRRSPDPESP